MRTGKEIPRDVFSSNCDTVTHCDAAIEVIDTIVSTDTDIVTPPGGHLWTVLLLVTSAVNVGLILSYELFIIFSPARSIKNTRKQVFLSQALLLGLLLGSSLGFAYALEPSPTTCVVIRLHCKSNPFANAECRLPSAIYRAFVLLSPSFLNDSTVC